MASPQAHCAHGRPPDVSSTSNGKGFNPFWNTYSPTWSTKLWSCIETDLRELESTSWSPSSRQLAQNSWFRVRMLTPRITTTSETISETASLPSPLSSLSPVTDAMLQKIENDERKKTKQKNEDEQQVKRQKSSNEEEILLRSRRIRIFPNETQLCTLKRWFGAVRFCYNLLVANQRNVGQGGVNLASMRQIVKDAHDTNPWLNDVPGEVKDVAVRDMDKARKAHFAKLKKQKNKDPSLRLNAKFKFRSKKDTQESFEVRGRDMTRERGAFSELNLTKLVGAEPISSHVDHAVRFVRDRLGRYFLVVPIRALKKSENKVPLQCESIVSLDPGVRTFQTTYDASGLAAEWGKGDMSKILLLCRRADKLQSKWQSKKGNKRRSTKRVWLRILEKIRNKVKEIHCKLAKWLCDNYKVILVPKFESSQMVRRVKRKIHTTTARNMLTWSHYRFRERLKTKAELYPWVKVIECDEPYTSKTCGQCGKINTRLGGAKTFKCSKCDYVANRDVNGARNILLRYLSLYVSGSS